MDHPDEAEVLIVKHLTKDLADLVTETGKRSAQRRELVTKLVEKHGVEVIARSLGMTLQRVEQIVRGRVNGNRIRRIAREGDK